MLRLNIVVICWLSINNVQNYFTYELRNAADGTVLGSLTYDPEVGDNIINLGPLTDEIIIEMAITAKSSKGLECSTIVSTFNNITRCLKIFLRNELNVLHHFGYVRPKPQRI